MSTEIEQRVLQMKFDNEQFESNTKTTMTTLDKLKEKLAFKNMTDGFSKISAAASKVDMSAITNGAENVRLKFSALEVFAITALSNIANKAIDSGIQVAKSLTIDPIMQGFSEYETKIGSIQTILANTASKGTTLDDVKQALEELNTYADDTIYNFAEMTRNIGTFTAAGVDLDTSTDAIRGIANLGAVSGSTSQQVSTAMYQLSQALANGKMKLQDWNSVINAGMGGEIFKEQLKQTARTMGINVDEMIAKYGSFNESLTQGGWATSDVLLQTLRQFAGVVSEEELIAQGYTQEQVKQIMDLGKMATSAATEVKTFTALLDSLKEAAGSGWAQTWELIIGDFDEAKALFTNISNIIGGFLNNMSDARNAVLKTWKDLGGRTDLIDGLGNIFSNLFDILGAIGDAFKEVFPPITGEKLAEFTKGFKELTEKMKLSDTAIQGIKKAFEGIFSVIKMVGEVLTIPLKFIPLVVQAFGTLIEIVSKVGGFFGTLVTEITNFSSVDELINTVIDSIIKYLELGIDAIQDFVKEFKMPLDISAITNAIPPLGLLGDTALKVKEKVGQMASGVIDYFREVDKETNKTQFEKNLENMGETCSNVMKKIKDACAQGADGIKGFFNKAIDYITPAVKYLHETFTDTRDKILDFIQGINWKQIFEMVTGAISAKFFIDLSTFLKNMSKAFENASEMGGFGQSIKDTLGSVQEALESYQKNLFPDSLLKIAAAIAILAASIWALAAIDVDKLIPALVGVAGLLVSLTGSAVVMSKWGNGGTGSLGLIGMAASLLILANAAKTLAEVKTEDLVKSVAAVTALMTVIATYSVVMKNWGGQLTGSAIGLIAFAGALVILVQAVKQLTEIPSDQLVTALAGIAALSAAVAVSSKILSKGNSTKGGVKLLAFATSIKTLASAVVILADLQWEEMGRGLTGIGVLMAEILVFDKLISNKTSLSSAASLSVMAVGLLALSAPLLIFSKIGWETMASGLTKVGLTLVTVGLACQAMPNNMASISAGLLLVSGALVVMSAALTIMSQISFENMLIALLGLGGSLAALAAGLNAMNGCVTGAASLAIAAAGLVALSAALKIMGSMDIETIGLALLTMASSIGILVAAAYLLTPVSGVLVTLSLTLVAFAASVALVSAGMLAVAAAIGAIATALATVAGISTTAVSVIVLMVEQIGTALIKMIPVFAEAAGQAVVALVDALVAGSESVVNGMVVLGLALIDGLNQLIPPLVEMLINVLDHALQSIANHIESITSSLVQILIGIIRGISLHLPELIQEAVNLISALLVGIFDAIMSLDFAEMGKMIIGASMFAVFLAACAALSPFIPAAASGLLGFGVLVGEAAAILALLGGFAQIPGIKWFLEEGGNLLQLVGEAIGKFVGGIIGGGLEAVTDVLPAVGENLSGFMENASGFFNGIKDIDESSVSNVSTLVKAMTLMTATSLVDSIIGFLSGGSPIVEFGKKLAEFAPYYKQYANTMSGTNGDELEKTSNAVLTLAEFVKIVPRQSELADAILGEKNITAFGEELCKFAPYFKQYAQAINGVDGETVTASANAATSLAEFAKAIPNTGGLVALFTGDNSLSAFAEDLAKFGPSLKKYSDSVNGLNTDAINNSVTATKAILEFAKDIPNDGGVVSWFTGDNSLSDMAEHLCEYGPSLKQYSDSVAGINISNIQTSVDSSNTIIELVKSIPKNLGSLKELGDQIKDLGKAMSKYGEYISAVDPAQVSSSVNSVKQILDLVTAMQGIDVTVLSTFTNGLGQLASDSVNKFVMTFNNAGPQVTSAVTNMLSMANTAVISNSSTFAQAGYTLINSLLSSIQNRAPQVATVLRNTITSGVSAIRSMAPQFNSSGNSIMDSLASGIRSSSGTVVNAIKNVMTNSVNSVKSQNNAFTSLGRTLMSKLGDGMVSQNAVISGHCKNILLNATNSVKGYWNQFHSAGVTLMSGMASGLSSSNGTIAASCRNAAYSGASAARGYYSSFYSAGAYLVQGFANGISSSTYLASARARAMASSANTAARNALGIHSPSKVGEEIGKFFDQGFANGISNNSGLVEYQSTNMANKAKDALRQALSTIPMLLEEDMSLSPVITPVIDLSNVSGTAIDLDTNISTRSAGQLSSLMTQRNQNGFGEFMGPLTDENVGYLLSSVVGLLTEIKDKDSNVYMDGKKVGKALVNPIDNELAFNSRKRW